jgi:GNAT superfamily N-acetyltransferase
MAFSIIPVRLDEDLWLDVVAILDETASELLLDDEESRYRVLAAVDDDVGVIGATVLEIGKIGFGPLAANSVGFIETLYVLPDYRAKGVGKRMICATFVYAWQCGCESVRASIGYDESAAISLCEKLGMAFVPEEDLKAVGGEPRYTVIAINPELVRAGYGADEE